MYINNLYNKPKNEWKRQKMCWYILLNIYETHTWTFEESTYYWIPLGGYKEGVWNTERLPPFIVNLEGHSSATWPC